MNYLCHLFLLLISTVDQVYGRCSDGSWPIEHETIGSWIVAWRYQMASNTIQFLIQGQSSSSVNFNNTYIALGWSDREPTMNNTDVMVLYIGNETIEDRYSRGQPLPLIDHQQDLCLLQINRTHQHLTMAFERFLTTGDSDDISFTSNLYLIFTMGIYTIDSNTASSNLSIPFYFQSLNTSTNLSSSINQCSSFAWTPTSSSCSMPSTTNHSTVSAIMEGSCQTSTNPCSSNGVCLQIASNQFLCQCKPDYSGARCQTPLFPSNILPTKPCQCVNDGICLSNGTCSCSDHFRGRFCQIANPCLDYCQNDGRCMVQCNDTSCEQLMCSCVRGFMGTRCDQVSGCLSNPCRQGTCLTSSQCVGSFCDYSCLCPDGTTSNHSCEHVNPCSSAPCQNAGQCISSTSNCSSTGCAFQCLCSMGMTGQYCETPILQSSTTMMISSCATSSCHYLSTCQELDNGTRTICLCPSYLTGDRCQYPNHCQKQPCLNQGTCLPLGAHNSFVCLCPPGFGHYDCSIYMGLSCQTNVCLNGGICDQNGTMIRCLCPADYTGPRCEWTSVCSNSTCENGGTCRQIAPTMAECLCPVGFAGPTCHLRDSCANYPCKNGGGCTTLLADTGTEWSAYRCVCPRGFYGQNCDTKISSCADMTCPTYQICSEQPTGPVCTCPNNTLGIFCQHDHPCHPLSDCQNGATCVASDTDPPVRSCLCPDGYTGERCQTWQANDPCASNPCQTRGDCALSVSNQTYSCLCQNQFLGERCERNNPCSSSPCLNHGICQAGWNQTETWFTCHCLGTYTGARCETSMLNPCGGLCMNGSPCDKGVCVCPAQYTGTFCEFENPCYHPICRNGGLCSVVYNTTHVSYTCTCPSAYTGQHCETSINVSINGSCASTCLNNGSCLNGICSCPFSYIGPSCQYENPCVHDNPCFNGGTCFGRYHLNGTVSTQCFCLQGYTGSHCEAILCSPTSCNGGLCTATQNNIVCVCPPGKSGDRCQYVDICVTKPCLSSERCEQTGSQYQCISCYDLSSYCSIYQLRNEYCDNRYTILVDGSFLPVPQACRRSCGQCIPVQRLREVPVLSMSNSTSNTSTTTITNVRQQTRCVDRRDDCLMQKAYGFCRILNEKYPDDCVKTCHPDCASHS